MNLFKKAEDYSVELGLPSLFVGKDGKTIETAADWEENRDYYKKMLEHFMYGDIPTGDFDVSGEIIFSEKVYDGKAVHEFVKISFKRGGYAKKLSFVAEITRPNKSGRFYTFCYVAFPNARNYEVEEECVCKRNYVIALFNYEQLAPDDNTKNTEIYSMFTDLDVNAVGLWAFCMMRLADFLDQQDYAVSGKYIATGHSRNGKAALCAGIFDDRFFITAPNNSGCGGCGCFRFLGGKDGQTQDSSAVETLEVITGYFTNWFSKNLNEFYDKEERSNGVFNAKLPFDLHLNKALIAPKILISLEAWDDSWANPYGSGLTHEAAKKVFEMFGVKENIEIQYRDGKHAFQTSDWFKLLDFCDKKLK